MKDKIVKSIAIVGGYLFGCEIGFALASLPGLYQSSVGINGLEALPFLIIITLPLTLVLTQIFGIGLSYILFKKTKRRLLDGTYTNLWGIFLLSVFSLAIVVYFTSSSSFGFFKKFVFPISAPSVSKCQKLDQIDNQRQLECYLEVARFEKNSRACSYAPNKTGSYSVKDSCYFWFATENKNSEDCKNIVGEGERNDCLSQIRAVKEASAEFEKCKEIKDYDSQQKCFSEI